MSGRFRRLGVLAALALPLWPGSSTAQSPAVAEPPPPTGGEDLGWSPCVEPALRGLECAMLPVPLDHQRPGGARIRLAVARQRATDPAGRLGALFLSAGGPAAAGTRLLPGLLPLLPERVRARFDVIAWDPRGSGASDPLQCAAGAAEARALRAGLPEGYPVGAAQVRAWSRAAAELGRLCQERGGALLAHLSTADTARDLELLRQAMGEPVLRFRGSGYGTLVGATYANLFPGQVRAMVLDGAIEPLAWAEGGNPTSARSTALRLESDLSSGATIQAFLRLCAAAGSTRCAFAAGPAPGAPAPTERRFALLLGRLQHGPIGYGGRPVTTAALFARLAEQLSVVEPRAGEAGGWGEAGRFLQSLYSGRGGGGAPEPASPFPEQALAVQCGESPNPRDPQAFPGLAAAALERSGPAGAVRVWADSPCATWPAAAAAPYLGPWNGSTPVTVLVIGNRYDPITPFQSSLGMARELGNARLLSVNGYGHTVLRNPSACATRHEAAYLIEGLLPPEATVCAPDRQPFSEAGS